MSDFKINNITDRAGSNGPVIAGVSTVSSSTFMVMPSGSTEARGLVEEVYLNGGPQI